MSEADTTIEYPELLADLADKMSRLLLESGLPEEQATKIGLRAADMMAQDWGGLQLYFPKARSYKLSLRDIEIWNKWTGRNLQELCRQYNVSRVRVYQIISAMRERETNLRQGQLF